MVVPGRASPEGPLLERDHELGVLDSVIDSLGAGVGGIVLIGGEAGSGKSTLLSHWKRSIRAGFTVLESRCDPLTSPAALWPLREIAPELGVDDLLDLGPDRGALFAVVARSLLERAPVVWMIDDVHWADGPTVDLIRFLTRRIEQTSSLLVLSFRTDDLGPTHPFVATLGELVRAQRSHRFDLSPLSLDAVTQLAGDADAQRIHAVTGGNAFFVSEVIARRGVEIPSSVREAVVGRVAQLTQGERAVVELVSIANRHLGFDAPGLILGASDDLVDQVVASGVVVALESGLSFRHELARQAVEMSIGVPARRRLHRAVLEYWMGRDDADSALCAHHALRSGEAEAIVRWCPVEARRSIRLGALREAVRLLDAVLRHRDLLSVSTLVELMAESIHAQIAVGDLVASDGLARELVSIADGSGDDRLRAIAWGCVAKQRFYSADRAGARRAIEEAVAAGERCGVDLLLAEALIGRASFGMLARERDGPLADIERAMGLLGDEHSSLRSQALNVVGSVHVGSGETDRGLALLEESLEVAESLGDSNRVSIALVNLATGAGEARRYDAASAWLARAIEYATNRDRDVVAAYLQAWLGRVHVECGRWAEALAVLDGADISHDNLMAHITAAAARARLGVRRGERSVTLELAEVLERSTGLDLQYRWPAVCTIAELAWLEGRFDDGKHALRDTYEEALTTQSLWARGETAFWMWMCGEPVEASNQHATPFDQQIAGDAEGAAETWARLGCPYEEGLARAIGSADGLTDAVRIFDALGAAPASSWVRRQLRTQGMAVPRRPRPSTQANAHGLTRRQVDVLTLAADGLTNSEIAARLFVSPRTVEHHMSAVLTKLGVSSRHEAIEAIEASHTN